MKWEYKAMRLLVDLSGGAASDEAALTRKLNEMDKDGWELIAADIEQDCFIFKRLIIEQA